MKRIIIICILSCCGFQISIAQNVVHNNHFFHSTDDAGIIKYLGVNYATGSILGSRSNFFGLTGSVEKLKWRGQVNLGIQNKKIALAGNVFFRVIGSGADLRNISLFLAAANSSLPSSESTTSAQIGFAYNLKIPIKLDMNLSIAPVLDYRFKSDVFDDDFGMGFKASFIIGKILKYYSLFPQYEYTRYAKDFKYSTFGIGVRRFFFNSF